MSTLYEGWVLEHSQEPRNCGALEGATHEARCDNPLCGDRVTVQLKVVEDRIEEIGFQSRSCAVATASASRMTELVSGLEREAAQAMAKRAQDAVHPRRDPPTDPLTYLEVVRGVRSRRRCATLAWEAMHQALEDEP